MWRLSLGPSQATRLVGAKNELATTAELAAPAPAPTPTPARRKSARASRALSHSYALSWMRSLFLKATGTAITRVANDKVLLVTARQCSQRHEVSKTLSSVRLSAAVIAFADKEGLCAHPRSQGARIPTYRCRVDHREELRRLRHWKRVFRQSLEETRDARNLPNEGKSARIGTSGFEQAVPCFAARGGQCEAGNWMPRIRRQDPGRPTTLANWCRHHQTTFDSASGSTHDRRYCARCEVRTAVPRQNIKQFLPFLEQVDPGEKRRDRLIETAESQEFNKPADNLVELRLLKALRMLEYSAGPGCPAREKVLMHDTWPRRLASWSSTSSSPISSAPSSAAPSN